MKNLPLQSAHREGKYSEIAKGGKNIKRECEALTWKHQEPPLSVVKYHSKESWTLKKRHFLQENMAINIAVTLLFD